MINLLSAFHHDDQPIRLNQEFRRGLTWWHELFQTWDGLCFFCMPTWAALPDFQALSDPAGSLGYCAIFKSHWFSGAWSAAQSSLSIAYKELFLIVVATYLWGAQWVCRRVEFLCDNESAVAVLKVWHLVGQKPNGVAALFDYTSHPSFIFMSSFISSR